jgi:hypothetical protein
MSTIVVTTSMISMSISDNSETAFMKSSVKDCQLLQLPRIQSGNGCITSINNSREVPFEVRRVYYLYDIPAGAERGGHAHLSLYQLIVSVSGSFEVLLDDGSEKVKYRLSRPFQGLLIVPGIWRELDDFSAGSISLVLASLEYDENDYLREYDVYLKWKQF